MHAHCRLWAGAVVMAMLALVRWVEASVQPDPIKDLCQIGDHSTVLLSGKLYSLGGFASYRVPSGFPQSSVLTDPSPVAYAANGYLRVLDLTQSFNASNQNTVPIKALALPADMPRVKQPALWANDNALYVYGGEIEPNGILVNGTYQNSTRLWPTSDVWKFDTGSEQWSKTQGTGTTVDVVANTEFVSAGSVQKGFALGGRVEQKPGDLSQAALPAIGAPERPYSVSPGMANFGLDTYAWTNQTRTPFGKLEKGSLLYMESPGEQGILVSLLGNEDDRQRDPNTVYVYDIATAQWFTQETTAVGGTFPPTLTYFCAVAVSAADASSHNIFVFGGIPDSRQFSNGPSSNDVYILSLPSFQWIKAGETNVGLEYLSCQAVNNRYMLAYEGRSGNPGTGCRGTGVNLLDLSTLSWTDSYQISDNSSFKIPKVLYSSIGGDQAGGATVKEPSKGFSDNKIKQIFSNARPPSGDSITGSSAAAATSMPSSSTTISSSSSKGEVPIIAIIIPCSVGGTLIIALLVGLLCCMWRRKQKVAKEEEARRQVSEVSNSPAPTYAHMFQSVEVPPPWAVFDEKRRAPVEAPATVPVELHGDQMPRV